MQIEADLKEFAENIRHASVKGFFLEFILHYPFNAIFVLLIQHILGAHECNSNKGFTS